MPKRKSLKRGYTDAELEGLTVSLHTDEQWVDPKAVIRKLLFTIQELKIAAAQRPLRIKRN